MPWPNCMSKLPRQEKRGEAATSTGQFGHGITGRALVMGGYEVSTRIFSEKNTSTPVWGSNSLLKGKEGRSIIQRRGSVLGPGPRAGQADEGSSHGTRRTARTQGKKGNR